MDKIVCVAQNFRRPSGKRFTKFTTDNKQRTIKYRVNFSPQRTLSPSAGRKDKNSANSPRRSSSKQSHAKPAPESFGYMKTANGALATHEGQTMLIGTNAGRTAHVSAVPRSNKLKVSGGTQTCTADLQMKIPPNTQHRSFSLTGPTAAQLSQSIRERFSNGSHSLPKPGADLNVFQQR